MSASHRKRDSREAFVRRLLDRSSGGRISIIVRAVFGNTFATNVHARGAGQKKDRLSSARLAKLATLARRRQMAKNFTLPFPYYRMTDERTPKT
jgi:hypothetical protein